MVNDQELPDVGVVNTSTQLLRSDMSLVEACLGGNAGAFEELVRRHKDRIYRALYRFLGNEQDALDTAQEVFVRAYRSMHGFAGRAQVYTWLYSIAMNLARNRIRDGHRKGRDKGVSLDALQASKPDAVEMATPHPTPRDEAQRRELDDLLQACLDELPDHYRLPFVLRVFEGLRYEEIADVLDCPVGTVKSRMSQARHLLRERLREHGVV